MGETAQKRRVTSNENCSGLDAALTGSFPREHPERSCLDSKAEAQLSNQRMGTVNWQFRTTDARIS